MAELAEIERNVLIRRYVLVDAQHRRVLTQPAPRLAGAEVEHDEAWTSFVGAVDEVGNTLAVRARHVGAQIEAQVVEIAIGEVDIGREGVGLVEGVIAATDVHSEQLGAAGLCVDHGGNHLSIHDGRATSVEDPKGFGTRRCLGGDVEGLDVDQAGGIRAAERNAVVGGVDLRGRQILNRPVLRERLLGGQVRDDSESVGKVSAGVAGKDTTGG